MGFTISTIETDTCLFINIFFKKEKTILKPTLVSDLGLEP